MDRNQIAFTFVKETGNLARYSATIKTQKGLARTQGHVGTVLVKDFDDEAMQRFAFGAACNDLNVTLD